MDWLTFIATMTGHLAWPIATIFVVIFFRKPILAKLMDLKKLTMGDKSAEFTEGLEDATEKVVNLPEVEEKLALPSPDLAEREISDQDQFDSALDASPSLAVLQSWLPIEEQLQKMARENGYSADRTRSPTFTIRQLVNDGTISAEVAEVLRELRNLRNIAVHSGGEPDISRDDAIEYRALSDSTLQRLKNL